MNAPDGTPTQAVLGFARILASQRTAWRPSHLCVAFDGGLPAERTEAWAEYKAQRAPMPESLRSQMGLLETYLDLSGVARVRLQGEEADDVIATLARRAANSRTDVLVASGDKDLLQLANERIRILRPQSPGERVGPDDVRRILGIPPDRVPEWLALTGDASDNIPGVPGIGPKTATALLDRFGSLDHLWARLDDVASVRIRAALAAHRSVVERNLAMMRLRDDLPGLPGLADLSPAAVRASELRSYLDRLGLRSLMSLVPEPELF